MPGCSALAWCSEDPTNHRSMTIEKQCNTDVDDEPAIPVVGSALQQTVEDIGIDRWRLICPMENFLHIHLSLACPGVSSQAQLAYFRLLPCPCDIKECSTLTYSVFCRRHRNRWVRKLSEAWPCLWWIELQVGIRESFSARWLPMKCHVRGTARIWKTKGSRKIMLPEVGLSIGFCVLNFTLDLLSHLVGSMALPQQQVDPADHCSSNYRSSFQTLHLGSISLV